MTDQDKEVQASVGKAIKRELHRLTRSNKMLGEQLKNHQDYSERILKERDLYKAAYEGLASKQNSIYLTATDSYDPDDAVF